MERRPSILIVDDEPGSRESLRMILKSFYDVAAVASGMEALDHIQKEEVDLITLDLKMPGLSGIDVLRELKKLGNDAAVIIITGHRTLNSIHEAIQYGVVDFVSKPFNVSDILAIVQRSLAQRNRNEQDKKSGGKLRNTPLGESKKANEVVNNH
jgi:DNA-binding NtrC family response regulator